MKKTFAAVLTVLVISLFSSQLFAQTYAAVSLDSPLYGLLDKAQMRGLCGPLPAAKPYTEKVVIAAINEILAASEESENPLKDTEVEILTDALKQFDRKKGLDRMRGAYYYEAPGKVRTTFDFSFKLDTFASGGLYSDSGDDQWGFTFTPTISVRGDVGDNLSYDFTIFGNASRAVLQYLGEYDIGAYWYTDTTANDAENGSDTTNYTTRRYIKSYANKAYFPYTFFKGWDGSMYKLSNLTASGLDGWCDDLGLGFGIRAEMTSSFLDDKVQVRFGRIYREWAAMDEGASLVLSSNAHPFLAFETEITPVKWFTLSSITGILEFPNSDYIVGDAYNCSTDSTDYSNAAFFQNAYSASMVETNFKYVHFDFGTTSIWPKRLDLGYLFPLMNAVFYQNNIGDYDNIALFTDLKLQYPGIGYVWGSLFLDEFNGLSSESGLRGDWLHSTRDMYATQVGSKVYIPWLPFATLAVRYTKVEPYCYTHQAINYTPWYTHYISEAYMNAGEPIGYYLPPNSDEINVRFETTPLTNLAAHLEYQFIRHGAEYGSQAVNGSSIYSELDPCILSGDRDDIKKYFLHDGAYQWIHVIKVGADWSLKRFKVPVTLYSEVGFYYSYYTVLDDDDYANDNSSHAYHIAGDDSEYPSEAGFIISGGIKLFF
ncbi:MAG TPA: hypothetical protein DCL73_15315 [Treponema sp.]|nr:hypothetical protein [Treponema sp.]